MKTILNSDGVVLIGTEEALPIECYLYQNPEALLQRFLLEGQDEAVKDLPDELFKEEKALLLGANLEGLSKEVSFQQAVRGLRIQRVWGFSFSETREDREKMHRVHLWFGEKASMEEIRHVLSHEVNHILMNMIRTCKAVVDPALQGLVFPHATTEWAHFRTPVLETSSGLVEFEEFMVDTLAWGTRLVEKWFQELVYPESRTLVSYQLWYETSDSLEAFHAIPCHDQEEYLLQMETVGEDAIFIDTVSLPGSLQWEGEDAEHMQQPIEERIQSYWEHVFCSFDQWFNAHGNELSHRMKRNCYSGKRGLGPYVPLPQRLEE